MADHDVCSSSPLRTRANSGETLKNENTNPVNVRVDSTHPSSWPFSFPAAPFQINGRVGSNPGVQGVVLLNRSGTYYYVTSGCPGISKEDTNPKTVIIS